MKTEEGILDFARYSELAKPSNGYPTTYFRNVDPDLFTKVARKYMPGYQMKPLPNAQEYHAQELAGAAGNASHAHHNHKTEAKGN